MDLLNHVLENVNFQDYEENCNDFIYWNFYACILKILNTKTNILLILREISVRNIMFTRNSNLIFCLKNVNTFYDAKIEKLKFFYIFH